MHLQIGRRGNDHSHWIWTMYHTNNLCKVDIRVVPNSLVFYGERARISMFIRGIIFGIKNIYVELQVAHWCVVFRAIPLEID